MEMIDQLAAALAKAQSEFAIPVKNCTAQVGQGRYRYADLASIIEATRPALNANGIAVVQLLGGTVQAPTLKTTMLHSSGQSLSCESPIFLGDRGSAAQVFGSGVTYARRYAWAAICGIVSEDDDDAQRADGVKGETKQAPPKLRAQEQAPAAFAYVPKDHPLAVQQNALKAKAIDAGVDIRPLLAKHTTALGLEPRAYTEQDDRLPKYLAAVDAELVSKEPSK